MVHSYYRIRGGECESFDAEAEGLVAAGVEVRKLSSCSENLSFLEKTFLPISQAVCRRARALVEEALDSFKPDILHVQNTFPLFPREIYKLAFARGIPVVQSLRNYRFICAGALLMRDSRPCEDCIGGSGWNGIRNGCYNSSKLQTAALVAGNALYETLKWRDNPLLHFITASDFAKTRFVRAGWDPEQISIKPNLIPEPECSILPWSNRKGVIFVGRLSEEKGIRELLNAWSGVSLEEPLCIVGAGPLEEEVKTAAERDPRIQYLGKCSRAEVMERISEARVLVLCSVCYETFGRTLAEAAAVGTPMVASRGGALEELAVKSGGEAVDSSNAQELGDAIVSFLKCDEEKWNELSSRAHQFYEDEISSGRVVNKMIEIYRGRVEDAKVKR